MTTTHPADPATREQSQPRPDRALRWPLFLAGLLGLSLAGHGVIGNNLGHVQHFDGEGSDFHLVSHH